MLEAGKAIDRVLKTAWFSKAVREAAIEEDELCDAIRHVMRGQADDLGGGVFKKRCDKNRQRSIILAKGMTYWVYDYLFAKKGRSNIQDNELVSFRKLAPAYATLSDRQIAHLLRDGGFVEICDGDQNKV